MISAATIHKELLELKQEKLPAEILVLNISYSGFEAAALTGSPHTVTRIASVEIKETIKTTDDLINQLTNCIAEFDLQKGAYKTIFINWIGSHFTLIPSSFYNQEKAKEMLEFNVGSIDGEQILTNDVNDIKFIYSVPGELKNLLDKVFPNHNFKHIGYSSLKLFFSHFQLKNADIFLNIHEGQTEVLIKKDKKPVLYNMFKTQSDEDILYFLMFSVEQFDLDPQTVKLFVSANRETTDPLFTTIKKYVRNVDHTISDKLIVRKEAFEKLPHHYYFTALNRLLCE